MLKAFSVSNEIIRLFLSFIYVVVVVLVMAMVVVVRQAGSKNWGKAK